MIGFGRPLFAASIVVCSIWAAAPVAAAAETPRQLLTIAAFEAPTKAAALARIEAALKAAEAAMARNPADREASLQRAIAISYKGKLKRNRADLLTARRAFEALVKSNPRDAEAQMALAGWHLGAVVELGPFLARSALGARKGAGLQALDTALALGGGRALFPAFASLTRIQLNPSDVGTARSLAQAAITAKATTPIDRIMQRQAASLLKWLGSGDGGAAATAAKRLLPFGRLE
jgi:tetratricopeptide (TPR) repeat protein